MYETGGCQIWGTSPLCINSLKSNSSLNNLGKFSHNSGLIGRHLSVVRQSSPILRFCFTWFVLYCYCILVSDAVALYFIFYFIIFYIIIIIYFTFFFSFFSCICITIFSNYFFYIGGQFIEPYGFSGSLPLLFAMFWLQFVLIAENKLLVWLVAVTNRTKCFNNQSDLQHYTASASANLPITEYRDNYYILVTKFITKHHVQMWFKRFLNNKMSYTWSISYLHSAARQLHNVSRSQCKTKSPIHNKLWRQTQSK